VAAAVALLVLAAATAWLLAATYPDDGGEGDFASGLAAMGWLFAVAPVCVAGMAMCALAAFARLTGRSWGRPLGLLVAACGVVIGGMLLGSTVADVATPADVRTIVGLLALVVYAAIIALVLQITDRWWAVGLAAVVPVALVAAFFGLRTTATPASCPQLTMPDGLAGRIVFVAHASICAADLRTGETRLLYVASDAGWSDGAYRAPIGRPALSPDGRTLALVHDGRVVTVPVGGGTEREIGTGSHPAWSPGGRLLAYDTSQGPGDWGDTVVADLVSGGSRTVAESSNEPSWSPDGSRLVVSAGEGCGLATVKVDGSDRRPVPVSPIGCARDPSWSPDGSAIAYLDDRLKPGGPSGADLAVVALDGSRQRTLDEATTATGYDSSPSWSPDGRSILFNRWIDGPGGRLLVVDVETGSLREIRGAPDFPDPQWLP
jgi:hypothetical protein